MIKENFIKIYEESFKENWALPALTDYGKSKTFTFGDAPTGAVFTDQRDLVSTTDLALME